MKAALIPTRRCRAKGVAAALAIGVLLTSSCSSESTSEPETPDVAGNWVSDQTFQRTTGGETAQVRFSIYAYYDPAALYGTWSIGSNSGAIHSGNLTGNALSLEFRNGPIVTASLSDGAVLTGTINGRTALGEYQFSSSAVTFRRGN